MKIAVVAPSSVPYVLGGSERAALGLLEAINDGTPHDADLIKLPSREHSFVDLVDSYRSFAELDLSHFDAVISTKYPSWMVRHPRHVVYMQHTLRGLYDTYLSMGLSTEPDCSTAPVRDLIELLDKTPPGSSDAWRSVLDRARAVAGELGPSHPALAFPGPVVRRLIRWLDRDALDPRNITAHLAISKTVAARPNYFPPGAHVRAVPLPSSLKGLREGPFLNLFTASRLDGAKRVELLIRSMEHVSTAIKFRVAGSGPIEQSLRDLAAGDGRIEFLGRISDEQLVDEYSRAFAVPFVPLDEDLGLVTIEAHMSGKPVITCTDTGGVAELVDHEVTGLVVAPEPRSIARAIDALASDRARAARMGAAGAQSSGLFTWTTVASALLDAIGGGHRRRAVVARQTAGRIVALSTYGVHQPRAGGQIRVNRLLHGLANKYEVDLVAIDDGGGEIGTTQLGPHLRQIVVERSEQHLHLEGSLGGAAAIPIGDIAAALFGHESAGYVSALRAVAQEADLAILAQPYMAPLLRRVAPDLQFIYDSQNAEYLMKRSMLATSAAGKELAEAVRLVEIEAVGRAEMVTVCSTDDLERLRELTPTMAEFRLIPNGTDVGVIPFVCGAERAANRERWLDTFAAASAMPRAKWLALFVGSYHPPNIEAARFILTMAGSFPAVVFVLAGSHCAAFENWQIPPNVVLRGPVPGSELRNLLASADVALNPMSSGAGTNLKAIEYLAAGVPSVSTPIGVRGLGLGADELQVVDLADFAEAVESVLGDVTLSSERARCGRASVARNYDWSKIANEFVVAVDHVVASALSGARR